MSIQWNNELYHYGIPRRSGRYKWGSGKNPYHHGQSTASGRQKKLAKLKNKRKPYENAAAVMGLKPNQILTKYDKKIDKLEKQTDHDFRKKTNSKESGDRNWRCCSGSCDWICF